MFIRIFPVVLAICLYFCGFVGVQAQVNCSIAANQDRPECNCVKYARSQVLQLPGDLFTLAQKRAVMNHAFPRVGSVAVHDIFGDVGHVSVVRNVKVNSNGSLTATVQEGNYKSGYITTRTDTVDALKIVAYFDPTFSSGDSYQKLDRLSVSSGPAAKEFRVTIYGLNFEVSNVQVVILGGWCDTFAKCVVPNGALSEKSTTQLTVPLTLNNAGTYHLYVFSPRNGKTSNGKPIQVQ